MKITDYFPTLADSTNKKSCFCNVLPATVLIGLVFFIGNAFVATDHKERISKWEMTEVNPLPTTQSDDRCKDRCRPHGTDSLPKGIIRETTNLEMRPLWGFPKKKGNAKASNNLLAIAVGIKQKENVNQIVEKFCSSNFTIMLFHYDGIVDEWNDLPWSERALHVSVADQTKWWFAKRFLHPDIVAEYDYIFLWDEDLGVENFNPQRYISIVQEEGLEISQPALDPAKSQVHHQITVRSRRTRVHRRTYKYSGSVRCYQNSTAPPCTGWVEMMAPVFSRAAWRCVWYMIQNDLIHAWGLDMKLGYCAQGDRSKNVGVVDSEYIVHQGIATLGASNENKNAEPSAIPSRSKSTSIRASAQEDARFAVRRQSFVELEIFKKRWGAAVRDDECWTDPYSQPTNARSH